MEMMIAWSCKSFRQQGWCIKFKTQVTQVKDLVFALMTPVGNYKEKQALGTNHTPSQIPSLIDRDPLPSAGFCLWCGKACVFTFRRNKDGMVDEDERRGATSICAEISLIIFWIILWTWDKSIPWYRWQWK